MTGLSPLSGVQPRFGGVLIERNTGLRNQLASVTVQVLPDSFFKGVRYGAEVVPSEAADQLTKMGTRYVRGSEPPQVDDTNTDTLSLSSGNQTKLHAKLLQVVADAKIPEGERGEITTVMGQAFAARGNELNYGVDERTEMWKFGTFTYDNPAYDDADGQRVLATVTADHRQLLDELARRGTEIETRQRLASGQGGLGQAPAVQPNAEPLSSDPPTQGSGDEGDGGDTVVLPPNQ